jgi:hypothetical protein
MTVMCPRHVPSHAPEPRPHARLARAAGLAALCASTLVGAGCEELSDFDTAPGESYCGQITLGNAFRLGFSPRVQLRLALDTSKIAPGESPGTLSSYDAGGDGVAPERLLDASVLRPITPLSHDSLSELEFGDGRERNLIYAVSPADPTAESLLAVLSLRTDGAVEVRLIRPGAVSGAEASAGRRPLFGVFVLGRQEGLCGF